jgi:hypothetical protein
MPKAGKVNSALHPVGCHVGTGGGFARHQHFKVLAPLLSHHHITDVKVRVDPACDAAVDDVAHIEMIEHTLRVHGGIGHADARQEQHHVFAGQGAGGEVHTVYAMLTRVADLRKQLDDLGLKRRDECDARCVVQPLQRCAGRTGTGRQQGHTHAQSQPR